MLRYWLYRFVRKRTRQIPEDAAVLWKRRLSVVYFILAWNAFGMVVYSAYKGKSDWAHYYGLKSDAEANMRPGHAWANALGVKNASVIRLSGFRKVDEYEVVDGEIQRTNDENTSV